MRRRLLLVEDAGSSFSTLLRASHVQAEVALNSVSWSDLRSRPRSLRDVDLLLPVVSEPRAAGLDGLAWLDGQPIHTPVLAILATNADAELLDAVAATADDFVVWREDHAGELWRRIERMLSVREHADTDSVSKRLAQKLALASLIGEHAGFLATVAKIPLVARAESPVLILGETGTGKELCARAIHHLSRRRGAPFIPVDCGALPDHLLENELFGHARGAFTDAHRDQGGLVAMAEGGVLFLDEIDSLAPGSQGKLLRLLQERTYKPLGADRFSRADIRIVAATNVDLEDLVRRKQFRSDLYFRLNVLALTLPPLRERSEDIPLLARRFVERLSAEERLEPRTLAPETIDRLCRAPWPGNVRELSNVIQRAIVFCRGRVIQPHDLGLPPEPKVERETTRGFRDARARALQAFECAYVESLLRKHNGNVTRSAREARQDRRAFGRLIKKYHIDRLAF
jgi:two-component system response regulator GlrR